MTTLDPTACSFPRCDCTFCYSEARFNAAAAGDSWTFDIPPTSEQAPRMYYYPTEIDNKWDVAVSQRQIDPRNSYIQDPDGKPLARRRTNSCPEPVTQLEELALDFEIHLLNDKELAVPLSPTAIFDERRLTWSLYDICDNFPMVMRCGPTDPNDPNFEAVFGMEIPEDCMDADVEWSDDYSGYAVERPNSVTIPCPCQGCANRKTRLQEAFEALDDPQFPAQAFDAEQAYYEQGAFNTYAPDFVPASYYGNPSEYVFQQSMFAPIIMDVANDDDVEDSEDFLVFGPIDHSSNNRHLTESPVDLSYSDTPYWQIQPEPRSEISSDSESEPEPETSIADTDTTASISPRLRLAWAPFIKRARRAGVSTEDLVQAGHGDHL